MVGEGGHGSERILITGAGGFVGRHLVTALAVTAGPTVQIIAAAHRGARTHSRATGIELDVTDAEAVTAAVRNIRPTAIVHLAAISNVQEARRRVARAWEVNLTGTLNLALATVREAPGCRFLFVGSSEIYGASFADLVGPADEATALNPINPYAASKAAADLLIGQMARDGLDALRLRPFNHTGPEQPEEFAIPAFAAQIARIETGQQPPVLRVGNLDSERDYLHVRDVVDAYLRAIRLPSEASPPGTPINIASGVPRRIGDVLDCLLTHARCRIQVERDPARYRPGEALSVVGNPARARLLLGWQPTITWEDTLGEVLDFWRHVYA